MYNSKFRATSTDNRVERAMPVEDWDRGGTRKVGKGRSEALLGWLAFGRVGVIPK